MAALAGKWVLKPTSPAPAEPKLRLFCFPQAGSGGWVYQEWQKMLLPDAVEVICLELPGRSTRYREPRFLNMDDLTTALVSAIAPLLSGPPFAFFGHSMGSIVAYESIKKLQAQGGPLPCMLYVSAMRSPTLAGMAHDADGIVMHKLPEKEFWATMERRYGKNPDLENEDMRALMYPVLKDDFALVETYTPSSLSRLPCPVSVLGGATDVRTNPGSLNAWSHCAPPGECSVRVFPGGHNYLFKEAESKAPFLAYLRTDLQHVIDGTRLDTGLLEEPAPLPETASLGAIAHSNGSLTSGECRGDSTAQQKSPASTAASAEHQQLPTSSGAERAGLPPSSTPSLCSEAGATVASGSSYALGPRGHTGLSVATMSRNGDRGDGASDGQPPSPLWEAPPPSKGCFQCVFCSWSH